ncbi:MAG: alpha/beta hydrolase [Deltaproteobacteria bacterium]|nr:MAG: alpha/beta hydrolase [Deltaproteobacteria bacterium]
MPSFTHHGRRIGYAEYGSGPRIIVLIHGLLMDSRMYAKLAPTLASRGHRVITADMPGHGTSDQPHVMTEYSMPQFGRDVIAVLDHLEVGARPRARARNAGARERAARRRRRVRTARARAAGQPAADDRARRADPPHPAHPPPRRHAARLRAPRSGRLAGCAQRPAVRPRRAADPRSSRAGPADAGDRSSVRPDPSVQRRRSHRARAAQRPAGHRDLHARMAAASRSPRSRAARLSRRGMAAASRGRVTPAMPARPD